MSVFATVELEVTPLEQDAHIFGFLHLDQQDALADRVEHSRRHVYCIASLHLDSMQELQHSLDVLRIHHVQQPGCGHMLLETQIDITTRQHVPSFRLAVVARQVHSRPVDVRVCMDGQSLTRIEQLDEQLCVAAVLGDVSTSEPCDRIRTDFIHQKCVCLAKTRETERVMSSTTCRRRYPVFGLSSAVRF